MVGHCRLNALIDDNKPAVNGISVGIIFAALSDVAGLPIIHPAYCRIIQLFTGAAEGFAVTDSVLYETKALGETEKLSHRVACFGFTLIRHKVVMINACFAVYQEVQRVGELQPFLSLYQQNPGTSVQEEGCL